MIICDTHVLVFDALAPARLSAKARRRLKNADAAGQLACADISLWEIAMLIAKRRLQIDEESFNRWFENFPPPVTQPNRLINPIEPKDDSEESRRIILATAKALETLSGLLHQTAENLARHAEQDVAKLHKLKNGIEERR